MLVEGMKYFEAVIWKRYVDQTGIRQWSNSYPLCAPFDLTPGGAFAVLDDLFNAEQFLHLEEVEVFLGTVQQLHFEDIIPTLSRSYSFANMQQAGREVIPPEVAVDYIFGLLYIKNARIGRAGKAVYRRAMMGRDVVENGRGGFALNTVQADSQLSNARFNYWVNAVGFTHCVFEGYDEILLPQDSYEVDDWLPGCVIKMQSIQDAQARKTGRSRPYREQLRDVIYEAALCQRSMHDVLVGAPEYVTKVQRDNWSQMVSAISQKVTGLLEYWGDGLKPERMINWRPTSGLDPNEQRGYDFVQAARGALSGTAQSLSQLQADEQDRISGGEFYDAENRFRRAVLLITKIGVSRMPGKPIPLDAISTTGAPGT